MKNATFSLVAATLLVGCGSKSGDSATDPCEGGGKTEVVLGTGAGGGFIPIADMDEITPSGAPQGGVGAPVRGQTMGLKSDDTVSVTLETFIDGTLSASFTNDSVQLFCQDDGTGLFFDQVVGLDPAVYPDLPSLTPLSGQPIELRVTVTDSNGDSETGSSTVLLSVGS